MPPIKPGRWSVNPANINPLYRDLWRGLDIVLPFWDKGSGLHDQKWAYPTITGSPVVQAGERGTGLKFDETDDYLAYAAGKSWETPDAGEFSMLVVLQMGSIAGTAFQYALSNGSFSGANTIHMWFGETSSVSPDEIAVRIDSTGIATTNYAFSANEALNVGFTKRGADAVLYLNGQVLDTANTLGSAGISNADMNVGRRGDGNADRYFGGTVFAIYKWDRELSAAEFALLELDPFGLIRPDLSIAAIAEQTVAILQASETDLAQALSVLKTMSVGQANETDLAQPVTAGKPYAVGLASETDLAQALSWAKGFTIGLASETDLAQALSWAKGFTIGLASETDLAQALSWSKIQAVGQATETDLAQALTALKAYTVAQAQETDLAQTVTDVKRYLIAQALEVDLAQAVLAVGIAIAITAESLVQFQRISGRLVTSPIGRGGRKGFRTTEGYERVSGIVRIDETDGSQGHTEQAMLTVAAAWAANSGAAAATLKAAIDLALQTAGFRGPNGNNIV